ncbi:DoxX family protein [Noviherbaspirillum denitrificans]|uniref:DoxX family protein n=1 Tax=Noviherbaspirillum denitrificans TaxID=1968433 RepID=A0A254TF12_9BURK|nr:DoxX family protein [Noviherbaspirillum denitrificans]OWW21194.1 DoxX family protein [Noviherbaspirillum denitrificans]
MNGALNIAARLLVAQIFLVSGINKIVGYAATQAFMESNGVSGTFLPLVILLEIGGAAALILGLKARVAAFALAIFTFAAGWIFHGNIGDPGQLVHFMKNLAIVGGLLLFVARGPGRPAIDDSGDDKEVNA